MEYTIEDLRRLTGSKSLTRIRTLLCRPEFERRRIIKPENGKKLVYNFSAQDLKLFRDTLGFFLPSRKRGLRLA